MGCSWNLNTSQLYTVAIDVLGLVRLYLQLHVHTKNINVMQLASYVANSQLHSYIHEINKSKMLTGEDHVCIAIIISPIQKVTRMHNTASQLYGDQKGPECMGDPYLDVCLYMSSSVSCIILASQLQLAIQLRLNQHNITQLYRHTHLQPYSYNIAMVTLILLLIVALVHGRTCQSKLRAVNSQLLYSQLCPLYTSQLATYSYMHA